MCDLILLFYRRNQHLIYYMVSFGFLHPHTVEMSLTDCVCADITKPILHKKRKFEEKKKKEKKHSKWQRGKKCMKFKLKR